MKYRILITALIIAIFSGLYFLLSPEGDSSSDNNSISSPSNQGGSFEIK